MNILFVTHSAYKYGAGRSLLALIDGLRTRGVSCHVIMPNKGPLADALDARGIANDTVPFKWWASNQESVLKRKLRDASHPVMASFIARKAAAWGADVIHSNGSVTPVGALAARKARIPHIWHIREFGEEDYGLTYDNGFTKSARMMADLSYRLVIISKALAKKYEPIVPPEKIEIVYNPVTAPIGGAEGADQIEKSAPQAVTIGMLHPAKGTEDAIQATIQLLEQGRQIELNIVGNGNPAYTDSLKQMVMQHHEEDHVSFLGYVDNPGSVLERADMVLVCSRSEAFGRVTIEGMLHKKPIIAARAGANVELIDDYKNGILYEPGNSAQLAAAMEYLLDHSQQAKEMGEYGFHVASKTYTIEQHAAAMYDIFCDALTARVKQVNG